MSRAPAAFESRGIPDSSVLEQLLTDCELFAELPDSDPRLPASAATLFSVPRGRTLLPLDDRSGALYLLVAGKVSVYRVTERDRQLILEIVPRGGMFNEASLVSLDNTKSFAVAIDDSVVCALPRGAIVHLFADHAELWSRVGAALARRTEDVQQRLVEVAFTPLAERLAAAVLRLSNDGADPILLRHSDIASIVGTYRENASRLLSEMRARGLVELGRGRIVVLDPARLAEFYGLSCGAPHRGGKTR